MRMDKNTFAMYPPMGWNSYDYYNTEVNEEQIRANADYMAKHMKECGWEYIVIDIEWYAIGAGTQKNKFQYIPFADVAMDEYSRLQPDVERFPSAADGKGFKPLADYIHSLGLKFGIHIMRGVPRIAAHHHTKILGTNITANEIAEPNNICFWNPDMYGINPKAPGAQEYYNSLFEQYAQWGVDFVKCDDICRMDMPTAKEEIVMLHKAIKNCNRPIVLSLSPGPAIVEEAWHYEKYANMWRITDDFWDDWSLLEAMFERCEHWQNHVSTGCYPDCDMIPVGRLGAGFGEERQTRFTKEEQITMMTLWCIFRSPLMLGAELTKLDEDTLTLLTNKDVLRLIRYSHKAKQVKRDENHVIWHSYDTEDGSEYVAVFNLKEGATLTVNPEECGYETFKSIRKIDLWNHTECVNTEAEIICDVPTHGAVLYKLVK